MRGHEAGMLCVGKVGFLPMFAMVFGEKGEFLPLFVRGRRGFLRCLPRFCGKETPAGQGGGVRRFDGVGWDAGVGVRWFIGPPDALDRVCLG
jgi:hypothetical protein